MKNNPVHLITEEDLKQVSILESNTSKKDKKDERRRKATGNKLLTEYSKMIFLFVAMNSAFIRHIEMPFICSVHL